MLKNVFNWFRADRRRLMALAGGLILLVVLACVAAIRIRNFIGEQRSQTFIRWFSGDASARESLITKQQEICSGAPFILPTEGFIGLLYGDPRGPYSVARPHQGIDIFSPDAAGQTPVYAAYDGYVTREEHWISSLIMRVPDDPLNPGRQIWLYYTHMASRDGAIDYIDEAFSPGTQEKFVEQGTLLGYTGNYGGNASSVAVHLHFSVVLDNGNGGYANELEFNNTVDPSRYLGMAVNYGCAPEVPNCTDEPLCSAAILSAAGG